MVVLESREKGTKFVPISSGTFPTPVKSTEEDEEELRRKSQARLAQRLKRTTARRLLDVGKSLTADTSDKQLNRRSSFLRKRPFVIPLELVMHEEQWVTKLTGLAILPKVGDETVLGTLESHVNGYTYTAWGIHMVFMHRNIKEYFMRLGDEKMPPLLQFRLNNSIMVGTKETKDVQFQLVPTILGQLRSNDHSDSVEKYKQTGHSSLNEDLKNFIHSAQEVRTACRSGLPHYYIRFQALEECEFYGTFPTGAPAIFAVTSSSLVVLEETPLVVIPLSDIEIVNLAQLEPGKFDMTVVFEDFKRDVLEIRSIPLDFLNSIKRRLDYGRVKYYVNDKSLDWNLLVKEIAEFPKRFVDSGGWDSLCLEDSLTLAYYPSAYQEQLEEDAEHEKCKNEYG